MALDVVAVLDALGVERGAYFGHSLGGSVGISLAHHAPARLGGSRTASGPDLLLPHLESFLDEAMAGREAGS